MTNPGGEVFSPHLYSLPYHGREVNEWRVWWLDSRLRRASRMTNGAERFSPLTCILSLIMGEKLMNGEYGGWIPA
jgi:hypothetical protein